MKFTCTQENLLRGIANAAPVAGRNSQLPILQYVLMRVEKNTLTITGTDLEVGIRTIIGGKMEVEGSCALPAKRFFEYVQQLPKGSAIVIEKKDNMVVVSTKGFRAQFSSADADEYPLLPETEKGDVLEVSGKIFCEGISRVIFAAAREEVRPEIRSVSLVWKDASLRIAATDGFRLAEHVVHEVGDAVASVILPLSSAQECIRLFSEESVVRIVIHDNYISFESDGVELTSRLVDGEYPRYEDIIPTTHTSEVVVDRDAFSRALKTLSVFLPKESRRVSFMVHQADEALLAKVAGGELGEGDVRLDITGEGEDVAVLINIQYVIDGVLHITQKDCRLFFSGEYDPVVLRESDAHSTYTYVVMPIQAH